eukprot:TRINITY_DN20291_c4_g1_i1.p1 TRINITY_DN20291_c4_g1~~TRINITY_DN20291_c4_g1_i1.p1  ORF type:complete len:308 (+),score=28.81 TRINITY_DN20291_c4_g1_i1:132-1055(+)
MGNQMGSKYGFPVINFNKEILPVEGHNGSLASKYPKIGSGGHGTVYAGMYRGQKVAFKVFHGEWQGEMNEKEKEEWRQSMSMLCSLQHPNLVTCLGVVVQKGHRALVMQFANRGSLFSWIHVKRQVLSEGMIIKVLRAVARALVYLHERKIIHRDIKTENILMHQEIQANGSSQLVVKLTDYDLTQVREETYIETQKGRGTLNYAAPELYTPPGLINEQSDIFSLAMVAYECLAQKIPWQGTAELTIINQVSNKQQRPELPLKCSPAFKKLIEKCWAHSPQDRPSASQLENMCDDLLQQRQALQNSS